MKTEVAHLATAFDGSRGAICLHCCKQIASSKIPLVDVVAEVIFVCGQLFLLLSGGINGLLIGLAYMPVKNDQTLAGR